MFLKKNDKLKPETEAKREHIEETQSVKKRSTGKELSRATASSETIQADPNEKFLLRKSSFDPTAAWIKQSWSKKREKTITIDDFTKIRSLGAGKYGQVFLVEEKKTKFICALKIIAKRLLEEE